MSKPFEFPAIWVNHLLACVDPDQVAIRDNTFVLNMIMDQIDSVHYVTEREHLFDVHFTGYRSLAEHRCFTSDFHKNHLVGLLNELFSKELAIQHNPGHRSVVVKDKYGRYNIHEERVGRYGSQDTWIDQGGTIDGYAGDPLFTLKQLVDIHEKNKEK